MSTTAIRSMSASELDRLVETLGDAPRVTYAPPSIYPMSAPVFDAAPEVTRPGRGGAPIGVYAHVPFCNYKCTFCFYATQPTPDPGEMSRYVAALERELEWIEPGTDLTQLYVGGGTPTTLPPELLDRLLGAIFARAHATPGGAVHTVECSPESVGEGHLRVLRAHGIGRVSMGLQTGEERIRDHMNRRHANREVVLALERLVDAELCVNVDLIYGLPGQGEASFRSDFELAVERGVHSVTCYNLRVNEKTPIGRSIPDAARLDAHRLIRWRELAQALAREHGFRQTRWHTFARAEPATAIDAATRFRDLTSWGDQLGVGVSARSRLGDTVYRNQARTQPYLAQVESGRSPVEQARALDADERRLRFVTLTLGDGLALDREAYATQFGTLFDADFAEPLARLTRVGVIADEGTRVLLTDRGKLVYDLATRAFYPETVRAWMEERQRLAETSPNLRARVQ